MQIKIPVTQDQLTRQERLLVWMHRTGTTGAALAHYAGVGKAAACRWLRMESLPWYRVQTLRDFGIPEELLPQAEGMHGQGPGNSFIPTQDAI